MGTGNETIDRAGGHYTIITADSHAGGSHAAYREYLDPRYPAEPNEAVRRGAALALR